MIKETILRSKVGQIVFLPILLWGAFCQGPPALAQTNPIVNLQLYAGLTISGTVGNNYVVQYVTNLSQTNWQTLTNLTLPSSPYLLVDTSTTATVGRFYRMEMISNQVAPSGMALISAGSFVMGDSIDGESDAPQTTVYVNGFFMDTNLVTYTLWQQVYQWAATNAYSFDDAGTGIGPNYPVQTVDWYDVVKWCNARSQMAGLTPVYYSDAGLTQVYKSGDGAVYANWTVSGFRLPTEAEWEKADRGGLSGDRFPWGNMISESQANYYGDPWDGTYGYTYDAGPAGPNATFDTGFLNYFSGYTSPVGYFAPNGYGLYDMAGNVFEWCWDWYGAYANGPQSNPQGAASGSYRVERGGSWIHFAYDCRSAFRGDQSPTFADDELGFRTVVPQIQ
jgi:formylglycine-generating enzyme required for sulfatase activity